MISTNFARNLFFAFQFGLILFACDQRMVSGVGKIIPVENLYKEFQNETRDMYRNHIALMWTISGWGDNLYNLSINVGEKCQSISGGTQAMLEQLKIMEETFYIVQRAISGAHDDIMAVKKPVFNPLAYLCRRIDQSYAQKDYLSTAFNLAKIVASHNTTGGRPSYVDTLITSLVQMGTLMNSWATIPEMARSCANSGFRNQVNLTLAYTPRHHILVKSVFTIVHKNDTYANSMQDVYNHMLTRLLPQITNNATETQITLSDGKTFWFFPKMMKMFYYTLSQDEELMTEFNKTVAIVGKGFNSTYSDFTLL